MMSRYQKHSRIATSSRIKSILARPLSVSKSKRRAFVFVASLLALLCTSVTAYGRQTELGTVTDHYVVRTPSLPNFELLTHTANMRIQLSSTPNINQNSASLAPISLFVDSTYRFKNAGDEPQSARLVISQLLNEFGTLASVANPENLSVKAEEQTVTLQPAGEQSYYVDLLLDPDEQRTLSVSYQVTWVQSKFPTLVYPFDWLQSWPNSVSVRINISPDQSIESESWMLIEPEGWTYAMSANVKQPDLKWLYDGRLPNVPLLYQFIHPDEWIALRQQEQTLERNPTPEGHLAFGNQNKQLYEALLSFPNIEEPTLTGRNAQLAQLFHARSVATYTNGLKLAQQGSSETVTQALLHRELAHLYRGRSVAEEDLNEYYAQLTVLEAEMALSLLPDSSPLRSELQRWYIEGLFVLLQEARQQEKWQKSLELVEQLVASSASHTNAVITPERLEEIRRNIIVQEALELLQSGNHQAAMALAAAEISEGTVLPPVEEQSLFASWQITVTVRAESTALALKVFVPSAQAVRSRKALESTLLNWKEKEWIEVHESWRETPLSNEIIFETFISIADEQDRAPLIASLPDDANWMFLREVLAQTLPQTEFVTRGFNQQRELRARLDLRSVGDFWSAMAARIERQVEQATASANVTATNRAEMEQIRRVNYDYHGQIWRDLAQRSWVVVVLQVETLTGRLVERSWLLTTRTPPQLLEVEGASLIPLRVSLLFVSFLALLALVSAFLWSLL